jgi:curved DNA-binding protein CbpA
MDLEKDYYAILHIRFDADQAVVAAAFKALAKKSHPDVSPDESAANSTMSDLNEAYGILSDPMKRADYDLSRSVNETGMGFFDGDQKYGEPSSQFSEDWKIALKFAPQIEESRKALAKLSSWLAIAYQIELLATKEFSNSDELMSSFESLFLASHFGRNERLQSWGKKLLLSGKEAAAMNLSEGVRVMGDEAALDPIKFLRSFVESEELELPIELFEPDEIQTILESRGFKVWFNKKYSKYTIRPPTSAYAEGNIPTLVDVNLSEFALRAAELLDELEKTKD